MMGNVFLQIYGLKFSEVVPKPNVTEKPSPRLRKQRFSLYTRNKNEVTFTEETPMPKTLELSSDGHRLLVPGIMDLKILYGVAASLLPFAAYFVYTMEMAMQNEGNTGASPNFELAMIFLAIGIISLFFFHFMPYRGNLVFDRDHGTVYFPSFLLAPGYTVPFEKSPITW